MRRRASPSAGALAAVFVLPLLLAACASGGAGPAPDGTPETGADAGEDDVTRARIVNQEELQMRVHLVAAGSETYLGSVPPHSERTFDLSGTRIGGRRDVQFRADPIGSTRGWLSGRVHVRPGETVTWIIRRP